MEILEQISNGNITVKWEGWSFGGGRDWGDWHGFKMYRNGKAYGHLSLGTNYMSIEIDKDGYAIELSEKQGNEAYAVLLEAIKRDDKELMSKINGNLPCGYEDISREDVLTGYWKGE